MLSSYTSRNWHGPCGGILVYSSDSDLPMCEKLSLSDRTRIRKREIGFIFQAFNLIGGLTICENITRLPVVPRVRKNGRARA